MHAVSTGAYHAVEFIKKNIKLDGVQKASTEDSKKVVQICTQFAQKGMINLFFSFFSVHWLLPVLTRNPAAFYRLPDSHCYVWSVPGHFYGKCRRLLG